VPGEHRTESTDSRMQMTDRNRNPTSAVCRLQSAVFLQPLHSILHQVRVWHEGHCIQRLYGRLGSHSEIVMIRTTVSTTEIRDRTLHSEHVSSVVPASRGPAEYRASCPSDS
jgi:hypothetical protein